MFFVFVVVVFVVVVYLPDELHEVAPHLLVLLGSLIRLDTTHVCYTLSHFPRYNMKCSGENVILRGRFHGSAGAVLRTRIQKLLFWLRAPRLRSRNYAFFVTNIYFIVVNVEDASLKKKSFMSPQRSNFLNLTSRTVLMLYIPIFKVAIYGCSWSRSQNKKKVSQSSKTV